MPDPHPKASQISPIRIGRTPDNDVVLRFPFISTHHAVIEFDPEGSWLKDLGSTNGTFFGAPATQVKEGDRIRLMPDTPVYFGSIGFAAGELYAALQGKIVRGEPPVRVINLTKETITIGRDENCDVPLDDPRASFHHATLTRMGNRALLEDNHSTNRTYVDGGRVTLPTMVSDTNIITIGSGRFRIGLGDEEQSLDPSGGVGIEVRNIAIRLERKFLFENLSFRVYPGEMVAIVGPSGVGKTTLLSAMIGYRPPDQGKILLDGSDCHAQRDMCRGMVGYLPQDDIMHPDLTVYEALWYTARLRLPRQSEESRQERIRHWMEVLHLQGREHSKIGSPDRRGLSGGERKRVNLAIELLAEPAVLVLDEPTSGLSSYDALEVVRILQKQAKADVAAIASDQERPQPKAVVATIHQPSMELFRLFDSVIVLGLAPEEPRARLVYYGPTLEAPVFFQHVKPGESIQKYSPDVIFEALSRESAEEWEQEFRRSHYHRRQIIERAHHDKDSISKVAKVRSSLGLTQCWTLCRRLWAIRKANLPTLAVEMGKVVVIAIIIVLLFGRIGPSHPSPGSTATSLFLLVISSLWLGCQSAANAIVSETAIYRRERLSFLRIPSYVASKVIVLLSIALVQDLFLVLIVTVGCQLSAPFQLVLEIVLLCSLAGITIGLVLSSIVRTTLSATGLVPVLLIPLIVFGGLLQPLDNMWKGIRPLAGLMPSRWAYEAIMLAERDARKESSGAEHQTPSETAATGVQPAERTFTMMVDSHYFPPKADKNTGAARKSRILYCLVTLACWCLFWLLVSIAILEFRDYLRGVSYDVTGKPTPDPGDLPDAA